MDGGTGNFGCWGLCDFAMGSTLGSNLSDGTREETETARLEERGRGRAKATGRKGKK